MGIIRKFAIQGHAVPNGYQKPLGPFPAEILASNPRAHEEYHSDSLHEALDDVRMFRCKECTEVLYMDELPDHECDYDEYEE
jgi:hypothetical protein